MAKKKIVLEEGQIFGIDLGYNVWTIGQLCNIFTLPNSKYSQATLAFFNYKATSEEQIINDLEKIDLSNPISIFTINGDPIKTYRLSVYGKREVAYINLPNFKTEITQSLGLYKGYSEDFEHILQAYFGIIPWDCFYKDNYIDLVLTPNTQKRDDVKYMKDFSVEELKKLLPMENIKLTALLEKQKV